MRNVKEEFSLEVVFVRLSTGCVCVCVWKYIKTQGKSLLTDLLHSSCLRLWIMFSLPLIDEFHPLNVLFMLFFHFLNFTHDLRISHFILDFEKWSNWVSGGLCLILKLKRCLLFWVSPHVKKISVSATTCLHVWELKISFMLWGWMTLLN